MSTQQLVEAPSDDFGFGPEGGSYLCFGLVPVELEGSLPFVPGCRILFPAVCFVQ